MRSLSQNTITVHPERLRLSNNRIGHMMPVAVPTISPRNQTCDLGLFIAVTNDLLHGARRQAVADTLYLLIITRLKKGITTMK